jgi:hypothetical protein
MAGVEVVASTAAAGSVAEDTSEVELRDPATVGVVRVLLGRGAIVAELLGVPMELTGRDDLAELTERRDRAPTVAGRTAVRPTVRDILAHMAAGRRRHRQVHVMVRLIEPIRQQPRGITALLALRLTAARLIAGRHPVLHRRPIAATFRRPGLQVEWSLPIDRDLL